MATVQYVKNAIVYVCMYENRSVFVCLVGVNFTQSSYNVNENSLEVQPVILLTRPLPVNITIQVIDTASTATSKLCICVLHMYVSTV